MTDKQIIYNCPHISLTDWGTYACKLYNPRDKNCIVSGGNCESNTNCPYKQKFEKDIDVPSKSKIMYDYNAKDCEQCNPDSVCCYCKNIAYYKLEEQLKAKEQKFDKVKLLLQTIIETNKIYPLQNNLLKLLDILEENENE